VTSDLVIVRVAVSDASGQPVLGLRKQDFRIFDRGKEQSIANFEVESFWPLEKSTVIVHPPEQTTIPLTSELSPPPASPTVPKNFMALYFDNLSTTDMDLAGARDAAERYLSASLHPNDRVAIVTSETLLAGFTDDPRQLREALRNLRVSSRARNNISDCPHLSDYQAFQITEFSDEPTSDAWILARDEMAQCNINAPRSAKAAADGSSSGNGKAQAGPEGSAKATFDRDPNVVQILNSARELVFQNQILARSNLQQIDRVVQRVSQMPGQRSVILVSPGFLTQTEQFQLDRIVDHAVLSQVIISSLDPRGLAILLRGADASLGYTPIHGDAVRASHSMDSNRESAATSVLAEVAQGTGGKYVHNNNDLKAGLAKLGRSPVYYILAFAPTDLKPDGRFHALKVTLVGDRKGFTIQARRGYFALKNDARPDATADQGNEHPEQGQQERIQELVLSKVDASQLPVDLTTNLAQQQDQTHVLSVSAHLDTKALQFRRDADHNLNTITFIIAVFDPTDKLIEAQQRHANIDAADSQLRDVFKLGLDSAFTFKLQPGTYRLRVVATDSLQHLVGAKSRSAIVP
jgi:VWFA-related protein